MSTIGSRIRALRIHHKLKQYVLAEKIGITQGSLSLIENNETEMPAGSTLAQLCKVLRTTPEYIIAGTGVSDDPDSIQAAIQEHEMVFVWRELPSEARALVLEQTKSVQRLFSTAKQPR